MRKTALLHKGTCPCRLLAAGKNQTVHGGQWYWYTPIAGTAAGSYLLKKQTNKKHETTYKDNGEHTHTTCGAYYPGAKRYPYRPGGRGNIGQQMGAKVKRGAQ
jgi:hypothetical protein